MTQIATRTATWNNIGADIHSAFVADAIEKSGLNFEVSTQPLLTASGLPINGKVATVANINGEDRVMGLVGDKYEIVQNAEAFAFADYLAEDGLIFEKGGITHNGMVYLIGKLPEVKVLDDAFTPHVIFQNSFNLRWQLAAAIAPLRIVCQNQVQLALREASNSISLRHTSAVHDRMEEAAEVLRGVSTYMARLNDVAEQFSQIKLSENEITQVVNMLFPLKEDVVSQSALTKLYEKREAFRAAIACDDNSNHRNSAWGMVNAYTDYVTHLQATKAQKHNDHKFLEVTFNPMNKIVDIMSTVKGYSIAV